MPHPVYTVQQLLADDTFLAYVLRTDPQAIEEWEAWLNRHPEQAATVAEATRLIQQLAIRPEPLDDSVIEVEALKLDARLRASPESSLELYPDFDQALGQRAVKPAASRSISWILPRIAASLLLLVMVAATAWFLFMRVEELTYQTATDESRMIVLPDSSLVFLGENSQLRFLEKWKAATTREVWLEGDAFFHVRPKSVPGGVKFQVHTSNTVVEVLGTRFNVSNRNQLPRVVLSSGKVKVNVVSNPETEAIYMQPGEMVEMKANSPQLIKTQVEPPKFPPQKGHKIVFEKTPVREVTQVIEEYYGLKVRLQEPSIANLTISGTFPTNNETSFLKALSVILEVTIVRQTDNQILFKYNR